MLGLLLIWILCGLAQGWGCPRSVMLCGGTPDESGPFGEASSALWAHCSVLTGGQGHSCVQLASTCDTVGAAMGCGWTRADVSPKAGVPSLSQDC